MVFVPGVVLGNPVGNRPMWSLFMALPREDGQAVTAQWAECERLSDPPEGAQEGLSMLRSQGGVGLGSQREKEEKEVVQLAEGDGDSCRGLEASGDLDI